MGGLGLLQHTARAAGSGGDVGRNLWTRAFASGDALAAVVGGGRGWRGGDVEDVAKRARTGHDG